ncbi:DNA-directed RNA polymerase III subunit RPC7 [Pseudomyrmex gracilis]|uniref:DNA-directed RNA polymerase III subunit RPC7 n=1 Tax=Pseudomyrmex gracilis TaxID=219809 RepID=UPI0009956D36|nr:DNA-directed RNA polymerase III subunit RPC7 [Pseudomyrmex gracilis]
MAGRMGGRGRGRPNQSFSMERELGISKGDSLLSTSILQPSPHYPSLDCKPPPINLSAEMSYLVELKRDFTEYVRESPNNVQAIVLNEDIERFCEDYEETIAEYYTRSEYESRYDWNKVPVELKGSHNKRKSSPQKNVDKRKKVESVDIQKKLEELEKTESTQKIKSEREDKEQEEEEEDAEDKDVDERVKNEDVEMDDGTDYANEYFENGDNYYSEDENDDGPTF